MNNTPTTDTNTKKDNNNTQTANNAGTKRDCKVPPIVLKSKFTDQAKHLSARKIDYGNVRATMEGFQINPLAADTYKQIVTFQTEEKKCLRVVAKGILENVTVELRFSFRAHP